MLPSAVDQQVTEFRLHGPLTMVRNGRQTAIRSPGPRALLALLLLQPDRRASRDLVLRATDRDTFGDERYRLKKDIRYLNTLFAGTDLQVRERGGTFELIGSGYGTDLDRLPYRLRTALEGVDVQEMLEAIEQAIDVGRGRPLEGLVSPYFLAVASGIVDTWGQIAAVLLAVNGYADIPMHPQRFHELFVDKVDPNTWQTLRQRSWTKQVSPRMGDPMEYARRRLTPALQYLERNVGKVDGDAADRAAARYKVLSGARPPRTFLRRRVVVPSPTVELPVSIWLSDGEQHDRIERGLTQLLAETGLEAADHEDPQIGSWFRRFTARAREQAHHLTSEQIAAEIERKLRIELFDKDQAAIDHQQATGVAALISALEGEQQACIRVGSLLILKVDGQVTATNLTQYQLAWLERNQTLLRDPVTLLQSLEQIASEPPDPDLSPRSADTRAPVENR